jgi:hypothetical protein
MPSRQMKPQPFPGESPTVALAMIAGQQYAPHPEEEKPKRKAKAKPARKVAAKTKAAPRKGAARKPRR